MNPGDFAVGFAVGLGLSILAEILDTPIRLLAIGVFAVAWAYAAAPAPTKS